MRYDAAELAAASDPYARYAELRAAGAVVPGGPGTWAVTRHRDVTELLTDSRLGHEFPDAVYQASGEPDVVTSFFRATVLNRDPPTHTLLRRAMGHLLGRRAMIALRPRIETLVHDLFAGMRDQPNADIVGQLAYPLPVIVAAELLGIPVADRDKVRPHALALGRAFGAGIRVDSDRTATAEAVCWLRDYVSALLHDRANRTDDPLADVLATAHADPALNAAVLVDNIIFLFFAGFDTTTNLIGTGSAILLRQPEILAALRAQPELAAGAVEEFLRYDAPIQATARITNAPIEIDGQRVRAGRMVVLLLGCANHDERQFGRPETVDITRSPNPHLGFSFGSHFCLGATLARIEGAAVFEHIARYATIFEPAGPAVRRTHQSFRGYERIPVIVSTR